MRAGRLNAKAAKISLLGVLGALCVLSLSCSGATTLFRQYEYEEEVYLSLDGTATVYVNSSLAALNALRGTAFDASPTARVDTAAVRALYTGPGTRVTRVTQSRRNNRRYAHVRLDVDDIRRLAGVAPFAWSTYRFRQDGNLFVYQQTVGASAGREAGREASTAGWNGREIVAFRLHLPSRIRYHNTGREVGRGNILAWEQPLTDRLNGVGLALDARMDAQSILYRTLWLFGVVFLVVAGVFVLIIWWVMRRGTK